MYNEEIIKKSLEKNDFYNKDKNHCITIQDKIKWLNVNNLSEMKVKCTDKISVKEYAKNVLGIDICPKTYKIYNTFDEININELPSSFILKINNGCAKNIYCYDKKKFDLYKYKNDINKWFNLKSGLNTSEYQYTGIVPKLFAEELLIKTQNESLIDYRFWCFNNKIILIGANGGHGWGAITYFDKDFNKLKFFNKAHSNLNENTNFNKPKNFDLMKIYAEKLSAPFKFVRVDMYNIDGKIYLGEMTFSPGGYNFHFSDFDGNSLDEFYGNMLKI